MKNNKTLVWRIIFMAVIAVVGVLFLRFIIGGDEDTWICRNSRWVKHGKPLIPKPKEPCGEDQLLTPEEVVRVFYSWYLNYQGNPLSDGAYKKSRHLTEELKQKIEDNVKANEKKNYDPILLSQEKPSNFLVEKAAVSDNQAKVAVKLNFSSKSSAIEVVLNSDGSEWKISGIFPKGALKGTSPTNVKTQTMKVTVYYQNNKKNPNSNDCQVVYGVERTVPQTQEVAKTSLNELFKGPTKIEKDQGYASFFSDKTGLILNKIKIVGNIAYVDFKDVRSIIPNASTSCGSAQFLAEVGSTLKHFKTIGKVIYAINGDPKTFYDWMQIGCAPENNNCESTPFK